MRTIWNTFYDQVWRVRCEKIQAWEKENNITNRMKKGTRARKKAKKRTKKDKQAKEEEKERKTEKADQVKKEALKTINMLVTEGGRPF